MKDEKLLELARKRWDQAEQASKEDCDLAEEDFEFHAGVQWPENIRNQRSAANRPCLTTNRLKAFVAQVVGDARQNAPAIHVAPVDDGADKDTAEVYEGLIRHIEQRSSAKQAYLGAFEHACVGGFGHWRIVTDYADEDSFSQEICVKRIPSPFAVKWDPNAKEYTRSDAMWCFVAEWMTKEAFEDKWPKETPSDWEQEYRNTQGWMNVDRVRVCEYFVKEPYKKTIAMLQDGKVIDITDILDLAPMIPYVDTRETTGHKVMRYVLTGHAVLEKQEMPTRHIPIVSVFGPEEVIGDRIRHASLIRHAKDPQRMYNFWRTAITEKIALAPKSPFLVTPTQVKGHEQLWASANLDNKPYLMYNPDPQAPGAPQRQLPAMVNQAEMAEAQQAVDDIKATMGMFDASLGAQGNETSGRAIIARQREGDNATFAWIDNLARAIEHTGRILVDMIPRIYDTNRVIRILGIDDTQDMVEINQVLPSGQLVNDLTVGKYDVSISVGPSYSTKRIEAADSMMQFVQAVPAAGQVAGDLIAKNMDWPGADQLAERLKKLLPPGMADDAEDLSPEEQAQRQQQQAEAMAKQAEAEEIAKAKAMADVDLTKAQGYKTFVEAEKVKAEIPKIGADIQATQVNTALRLTETDDGEQRDGA